MSFARFLLPGIIRSGRLFPTFGFIAKFAVPAALWQLFRGGPTHHIWIPDIFLIGTLYANPAEGSLPFWFLDILAASLLIFAISAKIGGAFDRAISQSSKYFLSAFVICIVMLFVGIGALFLQTQLDWWNGEINYTSVGPFRWFWLLPFGAAIQTAESGSEKLLVTTFGGLMAVIFYGNMITAGSFAQPLSTFLFASIIALIWCDRILLPRALRGSVVLLAQHSLFIYMFSGWVSNKLMPKLALVGIPDWEPLRICLAFAFGITASVVWNKLVSKGFSFLAFLIAALKLSRLKVVFEQIAGVRRRD
jgi:hypothetical protein